MDSISAVHEHCAIYTAPEAVEVILDLVEWNPDAIKPGNRLLEPACGDGAFLLPAVARLLEWVRHHPEAELDSMVRAYEFEPRTVMAVRLALVALLSDHGFEAGRAHELASIWVRESDFLTSDPDFAATHVVGNPPYMRWSFVPREIRDRYEASLPKAAARGDLCLAFIWKATEFASSDGARIGFLCADRWLRCAYGRDARASIGASHALTTHIEVHGLPVFKESRKVGAYAAISILQRTAEAKPTRFGKATSLAHLRDLSAEVEEQTFDFPSIWSTTDGDGARLADGAVRELLAEIDRSASRLNDVGVTIRCGTALGLAKAYIFNDASEVEPEFLLPYLRPRDLDEDGGVAPTAYVANVWTHQGALADLCRAPRLEAHLDRHRAELAGRACVSSDAEWYRTIDKIHKVRVAEPKLVVAGMARQAKICFDPGGHVASNALYCVTSAEWPLKELLAVLRAGVVDLYGEVVAPRFSGGTKRFDGNVLRQIRLPAWSEVTQAVRRRLSTIGSSTSTDVGLVADLYDLRSTTLRATLERTLEVAVPRARPEEDDQ